MVPLDNVRLSILVFAIFLLKCFFSPCSYSTGIICMSASCFMAKNVAVMLQSGTINHLCLLRTEVVCNVRVMYHKQEGWMNLCQLLMCFVYSPL